ncbi:ribosomal protection-like ABC-F family protein [Solibacillus isronensis]|uniref:ribosomal protection-like ABC-F family protein n=1 Tax=Solibacillus isronensis TaxID=412383 RepID=UPI00203B5653|nr:ABC-F type ribosomal protection protein [Solibacillus isronensis]MCM3721858.1 ABC-F type ribosomal protection protein [Solibacillus isronensis]
MPIELKNVSFSYDLLEEPLFKNINITIDNTWKLGLIGRNGRGKTTLLHLLQNKLPYSGTVISDEEFHYFPFAIRDPKVTTYYAINEVMPVELWKLERECQLLSLDSSLLWMPFEQLSGGEQTKVMLAAVFGEENRFLLLDEPTNHLDLKGRSIVANYLKKKKGFIVVSHDRQFIDEVVTHILAIEKNQISVYKGNFSVYEQQKKLQDEFELEQNRSLNAEINRLQKTAREKSNWAAQREKPSGNDPFGNAIAKRMNKRAKAIEKRTQEKIEDKTKLLKNIETISDLTINCQLKHRNPVLRVKNLTLGYNDRPLFQPISFEIFQGEQVAIVGPNGSGKTSLVQYLQGTFPGTVDGEMIMPQGLSTSVIRQNYEDNQGMLKDFAFEQQIDYTLFLNNLRIFGFNRDVFQVPIEKMSMGQQKKVEFSKSLGLEAEFYIWDEPLNYLDVFNHQQIEKMIAQFKPTLLFVEHDATFVKNTATKVIELLPYR